VAKEPAGCGAPSDWGQTQRCVTAKVDDERFSDRGVEHSERASKASAFDVE